MSDCKCLIFSESSDVTTSLVCKWLRYYEINFIRINQEDTWDVEIINEELRLYNQNTSINVSDIDFFWYRRGGILFSTFNFSEDTQTFLNDNKEIYSFIAS